MSSGPSETYSLRQGGFVPSAEQVADHQAAHPTRPPEARPDAAFGEHLAAICTGCHRATMVGGPIAAGPPDWPAAANLTPHEQGLAGWSFEDFRVAMIEAKRPDGTPLLDPMTRIAPYAQRMTDVELRALWAYLESLDAAPTGN